MPAPVKKIRRFMESCLSRFDDVSLHLFQINVNGRVQPVWRSNKKWTIDDTVPIIAETAQETANGNAGLTRFSLRAYDAENEERIASDLVMTFALQAEDSGDYDNALSEPATNEGLLAMLMRHNNELHRQSSGTWGMMFQYLTGIVHSQQEQIEKLTGERMQNAATMEELVSKKHERDMEAKEREAANKRKEETMGKLLSLLPVAVNKLAGKELIHQKETLFEMTSTEFIRSIRPDQLDALLETGVIDKHQLTLIGTMLEQVSKRMVTPDEKEEQSSKAQSAATSGLGPLGALGNFLSIGK